MKRVVQMIQMSSFCPTRRVSSMVGVILLAFGLWHCGPTPPEQQENALTSCTDDATQGSPFFGANATKEGKLGAAPAGEYYAVSTHMKVRTSSQESMGEFQRVMGEIQKSFPTHEGLLAASLYFSEKCGYARTLTVWKSYDAMMKFVVSKAHGDAMVSAPKIASHFRTTHWKAAPTAWPVTWAQAREKLLPVTIRTYD